MRANRFLGSALVDAGLVSRDDLEKANEKFMEAIQNDEVKNASIMTSLLFDLKVLDEARLIEFLAEDKGVGLVDLGAVEMPSLRTMNVDPALCYATSTIPFDRVEETYLVATCYYLSNPVVKYWEELLRGPVIWYATTVSALASALERIEDVHAAEDAAAEEEA